MLTIMPYKRGQGREMVRKWRAELAQLLYTPVPTSTNVPFSSSSRDWLASAFASSAVRDGCFLLFAAEGRGGGRAGSSTSGTPPTPTTAAPFCKHNTRSKQYRTTQVQIRERSKYGISHTHFQRQPHARTDTRTCGTTNSRVENAHMKSFHKKPMLTYTRAYAHI